MVRVATAVMMRIALVGIGRDLIAIAIDMQGSFVLAGLDATANLGRMRHADPSGQHEHQTGKEGQEPTHQTPDSRCLRRCNRHRGEVVAEQA